jgi:hypothetical protein
VDIRHAGVTTDSRDDVVVTDRSVWCVDEGDLWWAIKEGDCDELRRLLCVGLDVNQSVQRYMYSDVRPLLFELIDERMGDVRDTTEKTKMLLEAGVDVNVRVRYREYGSILDSEGVSVVERTRRLVFQYRDSTDSWVRDKVVKFKNVLCVLKKHVRRYSV